MVEAAQRSVVWCLVVGDRHVAMPGQGKSLGVISPASHLHRPAHSGSPPCVSSLGVVHWVPASHALLEALMDQVCVWCCSVASVW